jgi:hypothetical protein
MRRRRLPPWLRVRSELVAIRKSLDEGGAECVTGDPCTKGDPFIRSVVQLDGDVVTMFVLPDGRAGTDMIDEHVAEIERQYSNARRTLRYALFWTVGLASLVVPAIYAFWTSEWWVTLFGTLSGYALWLLDRLVSVVRATPIVQKAVVSGASIATALVLGRPGVTWTLALGLVVAVAVSVAPRLAEWLIRRILRRR